MPSCVWHAVRIGDPECPASAQLVIVGAAVIEVREGSDLGIPLRLKE